MPLKEIEVMKAYFIAILTLFTCIATVVRAQQMSELENRIDSLLNGKKATVGIAVWTDKGDMLRYNDHVHFPLLSVFKFHVALAVLDKMDKQSISLDSIVSIKASQMPPNTYSPLRKKFPDQDFTITLRELMQYSISQSDNNACDILFRVFGGPAATDEYLRSMGLRDFAIEATEDDMHRNLANCYRNWTTPLEAVRLLEWLVSGKVAKGAYRDFIEQTMISCRTGRDRLPAPLAGTKAVIGHKTGTGDRNGKGQIIGTNDIGFVFLPDGHRYSIAVLVRDSEESEQVTARIIADVSEAVYRYVSGER